MGLDTINCHKKPNKASYTVQRVVYIGLPSVFSKPIMYLEASSSKDFQLDFLLL